MEEREKGAGCDGVEQAHKQGTDRPRFGEIFQQSGHLTPGGRGVWEGRFLDQDARGPLRVRARLQLLGPTPAPASPLSHRRLGSGV